MLRALVVPSGAVGCSTSLLYGTDRRCGSVCWRVSRIALAKSVGLSAMLRTRLLNDDALAEGGARTTSCELASVGVHTAPSVEIAPGRPFEPAQGTATAVSGGTARRSQLP